VAVLQCKTAATLGGGWGEEGSDEVPVHYRAQVLQECDVIGVGTAFLALWLTQGFRLLVYEITIGDDELADMKLMREAGVAFRARVDNRQPPDVDSLPATTRALRTLHPDVEEAQALIGPRLARQWQAACRDVKMAEDRKRLAENRLRDKMGTARRAVMFRDRAAVEIARRDVYDVPAKVIERKAFHVDKIVPVPLKDGESGSIQGRKDR
jgi:predicted phage-related endonuclease